MQGIKRLAKQSTPTTRIVAVRHHLCLPRHLTMASSVVKKSSQRQAESPPPTQAALDRLQKVLNARDLSTASPARIAPGRVFRSGNPSHGTVEDVKTLRVDLRVRQMMDFRSGEEHREDTGWHLMLSNGTMRCYDAEGRLTSEAVDHNAALAGVDLPECELHRLSLLERDRFVKAMIWRMPGKKILQAGFYKMLGNEAAMRDCVVPEINRQGLPLVYKILMDTAAADICRSLELMLAAAEAHEPQLLFCKLGKDRTGMMSALVLSCCGATPQEIVADYTRSDGVDQVALGGIEKMEAVKGMDQRLFASAPAAAMQEIIQYAGERYGGLKSYMAQIGFGADKQARLAAALSPATAW